MLGSGRKGAGRGLGRLPHCSFGGHVDRPPGDKRPRGASLGSTTEPGGSSGSSESARTVVHAGGDPSSTKGGSDDVLDAGGSAACEPAAAVKSGPVSVARHRTAQLLTPRVQLKAVSVDIRRRRRISCDPVVRLWLIFEYS